MTEQNPPSDLCYPVLTPFKFEGVIIKPPVFIQLTADEAEEYIQAGVIDADGALPPDEAIAVSIDTATSIHTTTKSESEVKPAGGAPSAGAAKTTRVVAKKTAKRK